MASLLVTVGTDHHRFDRLIDWVDDWLAEHAPDSVQCLVQHGSSKRSRFGENIAFMRHDELLSAMARVDVVVTHGGPASLFEARRAGHKPICVPRDPDLEEIVDGHQQVFARKVASHDLIHNCEKQERFIAQLAAVMDGSGRIDVAADDEKYEPEGLTAFVRVVDEVLQERRSSRGSIFIRRRSRLS